MRSDNDNDNENEGDSLYIKPSQTEKVDDDFSGIECTVISFTFLVKSTSHIIFVTCCYMVLCRVVSCLCRLLTCSCHTSTHSHYYLTYSTISSCMCSLGV